MFIARDEDKTLQLFIKAPIRAKCYDYELNEINYWQEDKDEKPFILPTNMFKEITWEDDPVEVDIIIKSK